MRPSRRTPLLRGFIAAGVATFVALASHVFSGGGMPGMLGIAVPWLLSLMVCTLLAGRRLSLLRLGASVLVSQLLFHGLFVLGSITPRGVIAPHVHEALPIVLSDTPVLVPQDAGMWIGHGIAAIVTISLLHRGELALHALLAVARAVAAWFSRAVPVLLPALEAEPVSIRWAMTPAPRRRESHLSALRWRGPPRLV
ncbi:hypothetical protein [Microbacterium sp.]|uniref:hypothetical protein n=1 Tax=Microbacterium sp. TaxID=51671 RepID=UPI0026215C6C|nr:hypothetical protein [uncultured Microbacterium sp.]